LTNNIQDHELTGDDESVMPMYNVAAAKDSPTVYATLTPTDDSVHKGSPLKNTFSTWLNNSGRGYLGIDATTTEGQRRLAKENEIDLPDDFWDQSIEKCFFDLFWKVQMKGVKDGWTCCAEEGMHRFTAALAYYLCGLPHKDTGYLTLGSIKETDFTDLDLGNQLGKSDQDFRASWIERVFRTKKNDIHQRLPLKVRFIHKANLDAAEFAWSNRAYSKCQMVGRKESCNRSPFDLIGDIMGNDIKSMTRDQASRRVNFTQYTSPTYLPETTNAIAKVLLDNNGDVEQGYPWMELYENEAYQKFIQNPLDEKNQKAVKGGVLSFDPLPGCYHLLIKDAEDEMKDIDNSSDIDSKKLSPPLLPSFLSMAKDVGNNFEKLSLLNPDIVNGAYYGPMIITYLFALYNNTLVHKVVENDERILLTKFFLRFVNNANDKNTVMQIHGAWDTVFGNTSSNYFWRCQGVEVIIGCTQVILSFFNSILSTTMEKYADQVWNKRKAVLVELGTKFSSLMERIGQHQSGVTGLDQLRVLCK
jgi:hypothetical protein